MAMPVGFSMECIRWIRNYEDTPPERRVLADEREASLGENLIAHIEETNTEAPLYTSQPKDAPLLYCSWMHGTARKCA